ncbi:DUF6262 family protein [Mycolicibacterium lutetiense]
MRADNTEYLQKAALARSERTRRKAVETLDRLQRDGESVTVAGLARAAGVARSWIYTQPDLLARINTEHLSTRQAPTDRTRASDESWQRRIDLAHQRIKQLAEENRQLRAQLAIAHGQRRAEQITTSKTPSVTQSPSS